jgi:hypothetical protein
MPIRWISEGNVNTDFYEVRVSASRPLDDATAQALFACVGYAFRQHLRGEDLGPPHRVGQSSFTAYYDITKSVSDDWLAHLDDALAAARRYAVEGSPMRKTLGDTRLVAGIGPIKLRFAFR